MHAGAGARSGVLGLHHSAGAGACGGRRGLHGAVGARACGGGRRLHGAVGVWAHGRQRAWVCGLHGATAARRLLGRCRAHSGGVIKTGRHRRSAVGGVLGPGRHRRNARRGVLASSLRHRRRDGQRKGDPAHLRERLKGGRGVFQVAGGSPLCQHCTNARSRRRACTPQFSGGAGAGQHGPKRPGSREIA